MDGTVHGSVRLSRFGASLFGSGRAQREPCASSPVKFCSVVEMASGKDDGDPEFEDVPATLLQSAVWEHFGFSATYDDGSEKVVQKNCDCVQALCNMCCLR